MMIRPALPELASDLVRRQVRVIAAIASGLAARAAKDATNTIPIVFGYGADPVKQDLVTSLNRPGGNVTGVISLANVLFGKQLGILHELLPQAIHIGVLAYPKSALHEPIVKDTQAAASVIGQTIEILDAGTSDEMASTDDCSCLHPPTKRQVIKQASVDRRQRL
jgi:putative tryptophan/tyrosine transport system substrate-binding protein